MKAGSKRGGRRRAQAEIIGAIFFIVLAAIVFSLFAGLMAAQYSLARQAADAQLVVGYRADESLSVSLNHDTVTVTNKGPTTVSISYYIGTNGGGHLQVERLSPAVTIAPRGTATMGVPPPFRSVGVVTSYGNVWWS